MAPRASISSSHAHTTARETGRGEDLVWGRPVFRPPALVNPRVVFEPLPPRHLALKAAATGK